ncbi:shikimate kinase [Filobacillus milosensis]|uniref:Shikimate kinase n=1 Tax=Filobacillus milosensis TaxID=94137 RepID=A0A4Y8IQI1_9BACI|nr:shikimate kinase [Filobacillus milosensis]TFB23816.1 shikimate kinase [Filobacillus milosensis]
MKTIALVGFMGSGKTTTGKALAKKLGVQFLDTDQMIEAHTNMSIPQLFNHYGEGYFRELESDIILNYDFNDVIVATGGGIVKREANCEGLKKRFDTVFLQTEFNTILKRLESDASRPLWQQSNKEREELFNTRQQLYLDVSSMIVKTDELTTDEIVQDILSQLNL